MVFDRDRLDYLRKNGQLENLQSYPRRRVAIDFYCLPKYRKRFLRHILEKLSSVRDGWGGTAKHTDGKVICKLCSFH